MSEAEWELPPHDDRREQIVLSAWCADNDFRQAWRPEPSLFFVRENTEIAEVMAENFPAKRWNDAYTVGELEKRGKLQSIGGGKERVREILSAPACVNPFREVDTLRELRALRDLDASAIAIRNAIRERKRLAELQRMLTDAADASTLAIGARVLTGRELAEHYLEHVTDPERVLYCTTGFRDVDNATGGLRAGDVYILAAESSWGKSSWVVQIIDENVRRGKRVLVVSVEDPLIKYQRRIVCRRLRLRYSRLRDKRLDSHEMSAVVTELGKIAHEPGLWWIDGTGGVPIEQLAGQIRALCLAHKINLVVFDYAGAATTEKDFRGKRNDEMRYIGRTYTTAVKGAGAAGILVSQVTVQHGKKLDKHSIRDCRDLSNAAEGILIGIWQNESRVALVEKVKEGRAGSHYDAPFDGKSACFVSDIGSQLELDYEED